MQLLNFCCAAKASADEVRKATSSKRIIPDFACLPAPFPFAGKSGACLHSCTF
jgi:hypothetical protein